MSQIDRALRSLAILLAAALLMGGACAAAAQAEPYGELQRFGELGTGPGQLHEPEEAFGVDTANDSVYTVDIPKSAKEFRIQRFSDEKSAEQKFEAVASNTFKPKAGDEPDEVEGVAVDPSLERVYVLSVQIRDPKAAIDPEVPAASAIYAFNSKTLEPAAGTEGGLFVSPKALEPNSGKAGVSLLEPSGITVNPKTHELIVLATIDRGKKNHGGATEKEATVVLQRISDTGALGERYVDSRDEENPETGKIEEKMFFEEECECINSPVVSPVTGATYVVGEHDQIDAIPMSSNGEAPPTPAIQLECEEEGCPKEELTEFPGQSPQGGAQLSVGPEGRLYVRARVKLQTGGDQQYGGALIYSPELKEEGWTGGQSPASPAGKCIVNDLQEEPAIAAGEEADTFFMLQRNPQSGSEPGKEPRIIEFGPGGSGCPNGTATTPTAKAGGVEAEPFAVGEQVTLSSTLTQANAVSVEWTFGHEGTQTVSTREQQVTEVVHVFKEVGDLTVKEKIHTDNLATPVIEESRKVEVVGPPTVVTGEAQVEGTTATLEGTVDPNGEEVTRCEFEYGITEPYAKVPCATHPGKGEEPKPVSAQLTGLTKHTSYHFRLVAENARGEEPGNPMTFTTGPAPTVVTEGPTAIGQTSATLNATVNPEGAELTKCQFEYGTTEKYGEEVACSTLPPKGETAVAVSAVASGLSAGTSYYVRVVATNSAGEAGYGAPVKLETPSPPKGKSEEQISEEHKSEEPKTGVEHYVRVKEGEPDATLASGGSVSVSGSGAFTLKISCPATDKSCAGTVTVRTLKAVVASASHKAKSKAAILTLATGSFSVGGGQTQTVTLHMSAEARTLLARSHVLGARATIVARDPEGVSHTASSTLTLRAAKAAKHR